MPFALVFLGLVMVVSGAKDTYKELGAEVIEDFTGPGNFTWWVLSIGAVGSIGYYAPARNFSRLFLVLVIISIVLAQQRSGSGGFFGQLEAAIKAGPTPPSSAGGDEKSSVTGGKNIVPVNLTIPATSTNQKAQENFGKVMQVVKMFVAPGAP